MSPSGERQTIRLIGNRRMQCKDIPDDLLLDAVRRTGEPGSWRMRWDVQAALEASLGPVPEKLFLAKARKLIVRKLLSGCDCGCRGDYHLPEECGSNPACCFR